MKNIQLEEKMETIMLILEGILILGMLFGIINGLISLICNWDKLKD
ncbi:hypothetical protein KKG31_01510 [Patescibacteria group bacterium]|nr:hypothetical protein [Patescibacteria group bacterium]